MYSIILVLGVTFSKIKENFLETESLFHRMSFDRASLLGGVNKWTNIRKSSGLWGISSSSWIQKASLVVRMAHNFSNIT